MNPWSRRRFLAAMGLGAGSLWLPSLGRAQGRPPRRIVFVFTQHGTVYDNWRMRRPGLPEDAEWSLDLRGAPVEDFSRILRPLHPWRAQMTAFDGLALASALGDMVFNEHFKGTLHALTGAPMQRLAADRVAAGGASVDQLIARVIRRPDRLTSLPFSVFGPVSGGAVHQAAGTPLDPEVDPQRAFERLFPGGLADDSPDDDAIVRAAQGSVLDLVRVEYDQLLPRLSAEDRTRLALHRDLVRDLELRLENLEQARCEAPDEEGLDRRDYNGAFTAFTRLTAAALACDLTRVVTIQMGQMPPDAFGGPPGDVHADFAHRSEDDPAAAEVMTLYSEQHARHLVELCEALAAVPEEGGTLLDSTLVVWCGELASGTHRLEPWPAVVLGGRNVIQGGRYLRWPATRPNPHPYPGWVGVSPLIGAPHNRLLVSLARLMGLGVDRVGGAELTTVAGDRIDLTGPLPRFS